MILSKLTSLGVPSIKILSDEREIPIALFNIIMETRMLAIGSAIVKLNTYIRIDAIMAPNEPSKSS